MKKEWDVNVKNWLVVRLQISTKLWSKKYSDWTWTTDFNFRTKYLKSNLKSHCEMTLLLMGSSNFKLKISFKAFPMFILHLMLITLSSGSYGCFQKLHPTIDLHIKNGCQDFEIDLFAGISHMHTKTTPRLVMCVWRHS